MSGPKVSDYTLSALYQRYLIKQQEEERKKLVAIRKEGEQKVKAQKDKDAIDNCVLECQQLLKKIESQWQNICSKLKLAGLKENSSVYKSVINAFNLFLDKYSNHTLGTRSNGVAECQSDFVLLQRHVSSIKTYELEVEQMLKSENIKVAADLYKKKELEEKKKIKEKESNEKRTAENELNNIVKRVAILSEETPSFLEPEVSLIQSRITAILRDFSNSPTEMLKMIHELCLYNIIPLEKKLKQWKDSAELRNEYLTLCEMLSQPSSIEVDTISSKQLKVECEKLSKLLLEKQSREYISQAVQDCMHEMGYSLCGQLARSTSKEMLYRVHDETVLHVSCGENGTIAMEVGVASDSDRNLETHEVDALVEDMTEFCHQFPEIQKLLEQKGVVLRKNICLLPPGREYAQVFNISEFVKTNSDDYDYSIEDDIQKPKYMTVE